MYLFIFTLLFVLQPSTAWKAPWKPAMSFAAAAKPYEKAGIYNDQGYVSKKTGRVVVLKGKKGLGCSAYASAVLHRMRYGEKWLDRYDLGVHQKYGDKIASHFKLGLTHKVSAEKLKSAEASKKLVTDKKVAAGFYFFNTRQGASGHVGFVLVKADGRWIQSHYSGLKQYNGLATGDLHRWLSISKYADSMIELYRVL